MDLFGYRKIEPLKDLKEKSRDPGEPPESILVSPSQLVINEDYQRELSKSALKHILKMAENWDWGKFTSLSIAKTDYPDIYEVVDGQRSAIAAATNGHIKLLPALLSKSNSLKTNASNFIGINDSRIPLTRGAIYAAEIAAQDETAISVECALSETGARLLTVPPVNNIFKIGDTMSVSALKALVNKKGQPRLIRILNIAVKGEAAPITANLIKAIDVALPDEVNDTLDISLQNHLKNKGTDRLEFLAKSMTLSTKRAYETLADNLSDMLKIPRRAGIVSKAKKK